MLAKFSVLFLLFLVSVSCSNIANARTLPELIVSDNALKQYSKWLVEVDVQLADSKQLAGLSPAIVDHQRGESEWFSWVIANAGKVPTTVPSERALNAAEWIVQSYMRVEDRIIILDDGSTVTRKEIGDSMESDLFDLGKVVTEVPKSYIALSVDGGAACDPKISICTQYGAPQANYSTTNFTQGLGDGDGDWFDELDEGIVAADDAFTYWISPSNPSAECVAVDLTGAGLVTPGSGNRIHSARVQKDNGKTVDTLYTVYEGGVSVDANNHANEPATKNVWITGTDTISGSITDYNDIQIELCATVSGGGAATALLISTMEFELPDAPGGARRSSTVSEG